MGATVSEFFTEKKYKQNERNLLKQYDWIDFSSIDVQLNACNKQNIKKKDEKIYNRLLQRGLKTNSKCIT